MHEQLLPEKTRQVLNNGKVANRRRENATQSPGFSLEADAVEGEKAQLSPVPERGAQGEVGRVYAEIRETLGILRSELLKDARELSDGTSRYLGGVPQQLLARHHSDGAEGNDVRCNFDGAGLSLLRDRAPSLLQQLGADLGTRRSLVQNLDALAPRRTRDVVKVAVKAAMTPAIDSTDYKLLHDHGISGSEVAEILAMTAFSMYATTRDRPPGIGTKASRLRAVGYVLAGVARGRLSDRARAVRGVLAPCTASPAASAQP